MSFLISCILRFSLSEASSSINGHNRTDSSRMIQQYNEFGDDSDEVHVFIGYKNSTKRKRFIRNIITRIRLRKRFRSINAISAIMKRSDILELQFNDPDIDYIEEDEIIYEDGETKIDVIDLIQTSPAFIPAAPGATSACNDPNSMKIGVSLYIRIIFF